jgi:hypothetical protein
MDAIDAIASGKVENTGGSGTSGDGSNGPESSGPESTVGGPSPSTSTQ